MPVKAHLWKSALSNRRGNNTASDFYGDFVLKAENNRLIG